MLREPSRKQNDLTIAVCSRWPSSGKSSVSLNFLAVIDILGIHMEASNATMLFPMQRCCAFAHPEPQYHYATAVTGLLVDPGLLQLHLSLLSNRKLQTTVRAKRQDALLGLLRVPSWKHTEGYKYGSRKATELKTMLREPSRKQSDLTNAVCSRWLTSDKTRISLDF